jgi:hypothetical protein
LLFATYSAAFDLFVFGLVCFSDSRPIGKEHLVRVK